MWWFFKRKQRSVERVPPIRLERHLKLLSKQYPLWIDDDYRFVIVGRVRLPPGYNCREASLLIELPLDYPVTPPGVGGHRVYVYPQLRFRGRALHDLHPERTPGYLTPGFGPWAWWCYQRITWIPSRDDLIRLVEMIRADMFNPRTS